jgi:hypothetical protein
MTRVVWNRYLTLSSEKMGRMVPSLILAVENGAMACSRSRGGPGGNGTVAAPRPAGVGEWEDTPSHSGRERVSSPSPATQQALQILPSGDQQCLDVDLP